MDHEAVVDPRGLIDAMTARLAAAGVEQPRYEAETLFAHALDRDATPTAAVVARYHALIDRRERHEPLAYLLGHWWFRGLRLIVDRRVLVPRPATEALIECALAARRERGWPAPRIADVCTGSGVVGLTLAVELPTSTVILTDLSPDALAVAKLNADRLSGFGAGGRVTLRQGDLLAPLHGQSFEMIVTNPPYVPTATTDGLPADMRNEPRAAFDGGDDGLDLVRRLVAGARALLVPGGLLAIEHHVDQHPPVAALLRAAGFSAVTATKDLAQIDRVTSGRA